MRIFACHLIASMLVMLASASWAADNGAVDGCKVLVVVGMEDERAAAAGDDAVIVVGTANAARLRERLSKVDTTAIRAVFSFGVAGGLDPTLAPGDLLLSSQVFAQNTTADGKIIEQSWMGDPSMLVTAALKASQNPAVKFRKGVFLGTDFEARDNEKVEQKDFRKLTGADIIDNESHIAAKFANEHGLPFLSIRAVSDSVNHPLPPAALLPLDPVTGGPDGKAIAKSLLQHPLQIPALIRTAWEYHKALSSLKQFHKQIGFSGLLSVNQSCRNGK